MTKPKRILAFLLSVVMTLSLVPTSTLTASAEETQTTEITESKTDAAVAEVQALIDALPNADNVTANDYDFVQDAYDAYDELTDTQKEQITGAEAFEPLFAWFNAQTETVERFVSYIDENGTAQSLPDFWRVTNSSTDVNLTNNAYVFSNITINGDLTFETDNPVLVLESGATLTVTGKITYSNGLTISTVPDAQNTKIVINGNGQYCIDGSGNLNVYAGEIETENTANPAGTCYSIYVKGAMNVKGSAKVTAKGGKTTTWANIRGEGYRNYIGISYGIYVTDNLTVGGNATLNATGADQEVDDTEELEASGDTIFMEAYSYGIYSNGAINVSGNATVNGTGGYVKGTYTDTSGLEKKPNVYSYGIYANGKSTIAGSAVVTATGGNITVPDGYSVHGDSYGFYTDDSLEVSNSAKLNAYGGGTVDSEEGTSYGVFAHGDITFSGNTVIDARGSDLTYCTKNAGSEGIFSWKNITISGNANVTAYGGNVSAADSVGSQGLGCYKLLTINGTVTMDCKSGNTTAASCGSTGIYAKDGMNVNGAANITAATGEAICPTDVSSFRSENSGIMTFGELSLENGAALAASVGDIIAEKDKIDANRNYGINCDGSNSVITVKGANTSLTVSSGKAEESYAIYCYSGTVDIDGATVIASADAASDNPYDVYGPKSSISVKNAGKLYGDNSAGPVIIYTKSLTVGDSAKNYDCQIKIATGSVFETQEGDTTSVDSNISINSLDGKKLADILQTGTAFFSKSSSGKYTVAADANSTALSDVKVLNQTCTHKDKNGNNAVDPQTRLCSICEKTVCISITNGTSISYYSEITDAFEALKSGDELKLLQNVAYTDDDLKAKPGKNANITVNLNGHTLTVRSMVFFSGIITIKNGSVTLTSDFGAIQTHEKLIVEESFGSAKKVLTVADGVIVLYGGTYDSVACATYGNYRVGDFLAEGYGYKGSDNVWYDNSCDARFVSNVSVKKIPLTNIAITKNSESYNYGDTVTLTATPTRTAGVTETVSYKWFKVNGTDETEISGETQSTLTFVPSSSGEYTYKCVAAADDYSLSKSISLSVAEAEITNINVSQTGTLTYNGTAQAATVSASATTKNNETASFTYSTEEDGTYSTTVPCFTNAGEHTIYYKVSAANHATKYGDFKVNIQQKNIAPKITASSKTYNGTAVAEVSVSFDGLAANESLTVNVDYSVEATFEDSNSGNGKKVTAIVELKNTATANNYILTANTAITTANINKAILRITNAEVESKNYDGNDNATVSGVSFSGFVNNEAFEINTDYTVSGRFSDKNFGTDKNVTVNVTLNNSEKAQNYSLSNTSFIAKGNINALSATAPNFVDKSTPYTSSKISLETITVPFTGVTNVSYTYEGKNGTEYSKSSKAPVNVGEYEVVASFTMNEGYAQLNPCKATLKITKAENSWSEPINVSDWTYGDVSTLSGGVAKFGNTKIEYKLESEDDSKYTTSLPVNVGKYKVRFSVDGTNNYENIETITAFTIKQRDVSNWNVSKFDDMVYTGFEQTPNAKVTVGNFEATGNWTSVTNVDDKTTFIASGNFTGKIENQETGMKKADPTESNYKTTARVRKGRTLAEATVTECEILGVDGKTALNGTFAWADDTEEIISANCTKKMTFTPNEEIYGTNYASITIDVAVSTYSSSNISSAPSSYSVTFETNGGSKVDSIKVTKGNTIAKPTAPTKDGYTFDGWYSDNKLTTEYDFDAKVTKSITLYAKWTENKVDDSKEDNDNKPSTNKWKNPFTDVKETDWFFDNVRYANENGLMSGATNTEFAPNDTLTRGMLVTILYRAAGKPAVNKSILFADITADSYYTNAVIWAHQNGIVSGINESEFAPDENITREQIAAIIYRYAKYTGIAPTGAWAIRLNYADVIEISDYAVEGVMYCTMKNIMYGKDNNMFAPTDNATRAEIAAILQRFIENNK